MILGESKNPVPWVGTVYGEQPEGYIVSGPTRGSVRYIHRDLMTGWDSPTVTPEIGEDWRGRFDQPTGPVFESVTASRPKLAKHPKPAGSAHVASRRRPLLTIKLKGVIVIQGTEEAGVNIKAQNVNVITGGAGTVAVKGT